MQVANTLTTRSLFLSLTSTTINIIAQTTTTTLPTVDENNRTNISSIDTKRHIQLNSSALGLFLSLFCFITVFGNGLVIYAIVQERYLKSATYYYMASLACADLIVGLIVMPFAIVQVLLGEYWPFGKTCCDLWHSVDVCASTASILDLCVIALDRYSAITNPIAYHQTFFVKRWPYLLVAVWLCSGLISFPLISYWQPSGPQFVKDSCSFPDNIFYIIFSSLISFYIPLFVMIFVYIRIYRAAVKQLHAFKTGVKVASPTNKRKKKKGLKNDDTQPTTQPDVCLRIHRGKYHGIAALPRESSSILTPIEPIRSPNFDERLNLPIAKSPNHIKKSLSGAVLSDHQTSSLSRFSMPTLAAPSVSTTSDHHQLVITNSNARKGQSQDAISIYETPRTSKTTPTSGAGTSLGKRLTKFSKEQKATITLAYVMGIFVMCWLPFFVYNPLTAVAKLIIRRKTNLSSIQKFLTGNDLVFQLFTWFGYVNSSVNPIIYAYSSREFRRAFIKYLCRCFPIRIRNLMMSYHNLHLLRYRRAPESNVSKENNESGSDHNHNVNNNNNNTTYLNKSPMFTASTSTTTPLVNSQSKTPKVSKNYSRRSRTKEKSESSRLWLLTNCCRSRSADQKEPTDKHSSSSASSKATATNNVLVDYCTYHDVAISRVTCV